jgi:hypothetical protein
MSVFWTRVRHALLGDAVMPVAAVESYPGWEAVGEPTTEADALHADIERERAVAAAEAEAEAEAAQQSAPPAPSTPSATVPKSGTATPESSAPAGADPKE